MKLIFIVLFSWIVNPLNFSMNMSGDKNKFAMPDSFRFEARIIDYDVPVPAVIINVYLNDKRISQKMTNRQGAFSINLKYNQQYTFEIIKRGYIIEKIVIDTKVSEKLLKEGGIDVAIDNDLPIYPAYPTIKTDIFDKPVLYYIYNERNYYFEVDRRRSKSVATLASQVASAKNKLAADEFKKANDAIKNKNYTEAIISLKNVLEIIPNHTQANMRLKEIEKLAKSDPALIKEYEKSIKEANDLYREKKYYQARMLYDKAYKLQPENTTARNIVHSIDSILSLQYSERKDEFDVYKLKGNQAFKEKKYEEALQYYNQALEIIPEDIYVTKQITIVQKAIADEKARIAKELKEKEIRFNQLISETEKLIEKKEYSEAIRLCNEALNLNFNNPKAEELKKKAENKFQLLLAEQKKEKQFTDTLRFADLAFKQEQFQKALQLYQTALEFKPDDSYVLSQIKIIKNKLKSKEQSELNMAGKIKSKNDMTSKPEFNVYEIKKYYKFFHETKEYHEKIRIGEWLTDYYFGIKKFDSAIYFMNEIIKILLTQKDYPKLVQVLPEHSNIAFDAGEYKLCFNYIETAIKYSKLLHDDKSTLRLLQQSSFLYSQIYQYDQALENLNEAIILTQNLKDSDNEARINVRIGELLLAQNKYTEAINFYKKAFDIAIQKHDIDLQGRIKNNLGSTYYKMGHYQLALTQYEQAVNLSKSAGNSRNVSLSYNNIGNIHYDWNNYEQAINYYQKSLELKKTLNFESGIAVTLYNIGNAYLALRDLLKAKNYLTASLDSAKRIQFIELIQQSYLTLSKVYELNGDYLSAISAYKQYTDFAIPGIKMETPITETDFLYGQNLNLVKLLKKELFQQKILAENLALQNKQHTQMLMVKEMELQRIKTNASRFRTMLLFSILCLLLSVITIGQVYKRYKEKKLMNEIIGFQNKQLTDSITYASRIQKAILPPENIVQSYFSDGFILNQPKDIVSGDYFYLTEIENKVYVAVADCTGHGVPGAFMSILGISLIKEIIQMQDHAPTASEVLNKLRIELIKAMHQADSDVETKDGIDIALCIIDKTNMTLEYSGANNPVYIFRNKQLIELKADRMPIGLYPIFKDFVSQHLSIEPNDTIYLFSDGYRDQIGEKTLKKFRKDEFAKLLLEIHTLPFEEQKQILIDKHMNWRGNMEQTDDILVLGLRI